MVKLAPNEPLRGTRKEHVAVVHDQRAVDPHLEKCIRDVRVIQTAANLDGLYQRPLVSVKRLLLEYPAWFCAYRFHCGVDVPLLLPSTSCAPPDET
jgi:hypothetical protein